MLTNIRKKGTKFWQINRRAMMALAFVLLLAGVCQAAANLHVWAVDSVDEIHVDFGDNPGTSMWVHWRGAAATVDYGTTTAYGSTTATSTAEPITPVDTTGPFERVPLTGLTAGTVYHYRITSSGDDHTFKTAPSGDFVWDDIGDTGTTYYDSSSDPSCNKPWMSSVWSQIAGEAPDLVTHGGDISYANECGNAATHQYYQDTAPVATTRAMEQVWGNHEYGPVNTATAPSGTVRDSMANYKGRVYIPNPQTVINDTTGQVSNPGCPGVPTTANGCQGSDWGSFVVGRVLYITEPEPWYNAYLGTDGTGTDTNSWQYKADQLMSAAQTNPNIDMIVTMGHRPAYTSIWDSSTGTFADETDLQQAINYLGDKYSPTAVSGGKYVLNVNHHIHAMERFAPQHGVVQITDGAGGTEEASFNTQHIADGSMFHSSHFGHLRVTVTGNSMQLDFICGPVYPDNPTKDACNQGDVIDSSVVSTTPAVLPPPATTCNDSVAFPTGNQYIDAASRSVESPSTQSASWSGVWGTTTHVSWDSTQACDGYASVKAAVKDGTVTPDTIMGVNGSNPFVNLSSIATDNYTASTWIKANTTGNIYDIQIQEKDSTGANVGKNTVQWTAPDTDWHQITSTLAAANANDSMYMRVWQENPVVGDYFNVDQLSLTSTPPPPPISSQSVCSDTTASSEAITNRSVETDLTGWGGVASAADNIVPDNQAACDGSQSISVSYFPGQFAAGKGLGVNSSPYWVTNTTVNTNYTGFVWIKGVSGKTYRLVLQEKTSDGTVVDSNNNTMTVSDSNWHKLTTTYTATASGNSIVFKISEDAPADGDVFHADNMSLTSVAGTPPISPQTLCSDTTAANEIITNRSVEGDITGWTGILSSASGVALDNTQACDGGYSIGVKNTSTSTSAIGFNSSPAWTATTATNIYTAKTWMRSSVSGRTLRLLLQEKNAAGTVIGSNVSTLTVSDTNWHQLTTTYTGITTGDSLYYKVSEDSASPGDSFNADQMSLTSSTQTIAPPSSYCSDSPAGTQLVTNRSVETNLTGWTGVISSASNNTRDGSIAGSACDGSYSIKTMLKSGQSDNQMGFTNPSPYWVNSATVAGRKYTLSVWVKGTSSRVIKLYVCERNGSGCISGRWASTSRTTSDNGWHKLSMTYTAVSSGNSLSTKIWMERTDGTSNLLSTDYLYSDNMSMTY
ncbi:MAG TPA: carbohydrate binding domain-containing protein [Candidatus Saccharimonadales bacterium]|nr:carbohydrate binding domain-containing protein [Candidatus Saccharimonadales bacterium]